MKKHINAASADYESDWESKREKIIGLGELSFRKSYFPQLQKRLGELERFRTLLEQAGEAIFLIEIPSGNIVDANHTASVYTGLSHIELLKLTLFDLGDEISSERVRKFFQGVQRNDKSEMRHMVLLGSLRNSKGDQIPVESNIQINTLNNVTYAAIVSRDVTERKRAEQELIEAKERAESTDRAKTEFLNIASHELRTPLTSINLLLTIFKKQKQQHPGDLSICDRIQKQVQRLTSIVDDLIDISRLERGVLTLHLSPHDMIKIVSEAIEVVRMRIPNRRLIATYPAQPITVEIDPIRIGQVLDNLLDNAVKYSPASEPIEVNVEIIQSFVRTTVTDHGAGIDEKELPFLFSRFYRSTSDVVRKSPGLGLGLYISKEIVERHGGHIGIKTISGHGSTFYFDLPLKRVTPAS